MRIYAFFPSFLKKSNSCRCVALVQHWSLFTPVSSRTNPDEFPHLISSDQRPWDQQQSQDAWLYSVFGDELLAAQIWLISLFGLLRCSPVSHNVGGHFENQGMAMTQQQGVQPEFLLAPLSWEPSGRRRGVRSAVKSPTCLGTWKAWLTIPFEATGCKGAGHWQVRTKMGLIVRGTPREHYTGLGATLTPSSSLSTRWPCLISSHPERADIRQHGQKNYRPFLMNIFQLVYKNNPSLTQTTSSDHEDQNGLLFFICLLEWKKQHL